jgi:uridine phosphorylase
MKPHIRLSSDPRFKRAVVCGAPERAALIASQLEGAKELSKNREYHSYIGKHKGVEVMAVSHGVGSAGATICFQELMDVGVESIIRVGTAGGLQDDSQIGDVALATAAVRQEGVTPLMVPMGFPAVADPALTASLARALKEKGRKFHQGVIVTSDLFYPGLLENDLKLYQKAGAVAVEMECSALFVSAWLRKVKAAGVLALDGNPLKWSEGNYNPQAGSLDQALRAAIAAALDAIVAPLE